MKTIYQFSQTETILNFSPICPIDEPTDACLVGERGLIHRVGANTYRVTVFKSNGDEVSDYCAASAFKKLSTIGFDPNRQLEFVAKHASNSIF